MEEQKIIRVELTPFLRLHALKKKLGYRTINYLIVRLLNEADKWDLK